MIQTTSTPIYSKMAPTATDLFGPNPWLTNVGGHGLGISYSYNPLYFATPATAAKVAQMLGGKVVVYDAITPYGPFQQNEPNQMIEMPDGKHIYAGVIAGFYSHGLTQETVEAMVLEEVGPDNIRLAVLPRVEIPISRPPTDNLPFPILETQYAIGDVMNCPAGDHWPVGHIEVDEVTGAQYEKMSHSNPFSPSRRVYFYERIK